MTNRSYKTINEAMKKVYEESEGLLCLEVYTPDYTSIYFSNRRENLVEVMNGHANGRIQVDGYGEYSFENGGAAYIRKAKGSGPWVCFSGEFGEGMNIVLHKDEKSAMKMATQIFKSHEAVETSVEYWELDDRGNMHAAKGFADPDAGFFAAYGKAEYV